MIFIVRDLGWMEKLLTSSLGAKKVCDSGNQTFSFVKKLFFTMGDLSPAIMEGDPLPSRTYNRIAFKIESRDYDILLSRINELGLQLRELNASERPVLRAHRR